MNDRTDSSQVSQNTKRGAQGVADIDVIIPAFNEEQNIPFALRSVVGWTRRVFVVDSESTDRTREISESMGAQVVVQPWLGYAAQKNWALDNLPLEANWIFILDADESITDDLRRELTEMSLRDPTEVPEAGFYVNRLTYFLGRPIRHCGFFPSYNLRFFKRGVAHYEDREVHEHMIVDGQTSRLKHLMLHEDRRGLEHFVAKHNRYSTLEARELWKHRARSSGQRAEKLEFGIAMRRWLKYHIQPRLPLAGLWRFLYTYFLRLGILDGANGLRFCLFLATYDTLISLKLSELKAMGISPSDAASIPAAVRGLRIAEGEVSIGTGSAGDKSMPTAIPESRATIRESGAAPDTAGPSLVPETHKHGERVEGKIRGRGRRVPADGLRAYTPRDVACLVKPPVSVIVLTYNEEENIRACLESCAWCDDVHVLDSGSTDRTCEIAEEMGAKVYVNPFQSFGQQRNWAIDNIPVKHRWQFQLDADERFTPALVREMHERIKGGASVDGVCCYRCPSMMMFMDQWLRYAADYPVYQVRLIDPHRCRYEDYGHGQREVPTGPTGALAMPYMHYNFSKGVDEWFEKHNRYSSLEARQAQSERAVPLRQAGRDLFAKDPLVRRRAMKSIGYKMPMRATAIMVYALFVRRGFMDGLAGFNYTRMRSIYEGMVAVKMSVLRQKRRRGALDKS